ncbi:hypothetical protein [Metabacillus fastidiosus]|uniref:hypothetical protein n=1 Tax=Metabacillus fastidiosus TaxID=1458 RepID=UPI002DB7CAE3|nr:hypothetical protein [Metabacillus fastidiosus]MEC2076389.1 hypothetical protein [Metabacillus fastidiosus]
MREEKIKQDDLKFYIFGSFGKVEKPNDIDLLFLYESDNVSIKEILSLRRSFVMKFRVVSDIDVDITILSHREEQELDFINTENAKELFL